jgi:hypothetical protein
MYIIYDTNTGNIVRRGSHEFQSVAQGFAQVEIPTTQFELNTHRYDATTQQIVERDDAQDTVNAMRISNIRTRRNMLLARSDWTQLPDNTLTEQQRAQWAAYRVALRDFPDTITAPAPEHEMMAAWPQPPQQ